MSNRKRGLLAVLIAAIPTIALAILLAYYHVSEPAISIYCGVAGFIFGGAAARLVWRIF